MAAKKNTTIATAEKISKKKKNAAGDNTLLTKKKSRKSVKNDTTNKKVSTQTKKSAKEAGSKPKKIEKKDNTKKRSEKKKRTEKTGTTQARQHKDQNLLFPSKTLKQTLSVQQRNDSFLHKFYSDFESFIKSNLFIEEGSEIMVAVSGGVDSTVLLDILAVLAPKYHFRLYVAHYNHCLRSISSDKDEKFVRKLADQYGLKVTTSKGKVKQYAEKHSLSLEHAARVLRYLFLERESINYNLALVATAHNSDDSAETFLLNLIRGSGLTGLSGIPDKRALGKKVTLIRPLLWCSKSDIIKYAKKRKLKWREDETNSLLNYTRNRIRHDLIPNLEKNYNPRIVEIINRAAKHINGADKNIYEQVQYILDDIIFDKTSERFSIKIPLLQTFDEFIQGEIIQSALKKHMQIHFMSINSIDRILSLAEKPVGSMYEFSGRIIVYKDRNSLMFTRKQINEDFDILVEREGIYESPKHILTLKQINKRSFKIDENPKIEYFDYHKLPMLMNWRKWSPGDSFRPLGMGGSLKISDFLINEKIPLYEKQNILVLCGKGQIIWVCGKRISNDFKVTEKTEKIIKATIESADEKG